MRAYQIRRSRLGHCRSLLEQTESCDREDGAPPLVSLSSSLNTQIRRASRMESRFDLILGRCAGQNLVTSHSARQETPVSIVKMCLKLGQWMTLGSDQISWGGAAEECKGERDTETEHSVQLGSSELGVEGWY